MLQYLIQPGLAHVVAVATVAEVRQHFRAEAIEEAAPRLDLQLHRARQSDDNQGDTRIHLRSDNRNTVSRVPGTQARLLMSH